MCGRGFRRVRAASTLPIGSKAIICPIATSMRLTHMHTYLALKAEVFVQDALWVLSCACCGQRSYLANPHMP